MAPTKPAARRGRPAKSEDTPKAKKDEASAAANGTESAKRRGRPPMEGAAKVTKPKVAGRGRGRPPLSPSQRKTPKAAYVPTGRPRGRPPKKGGPAKAKKPAGTSGPGKRGRPRKSDAAAEDVPAENDEKDDTGKEAEDGDVEADADVVSEEED